jgi:ATP-binding cassette subfamily B protein
VSLAQVRGDLAFENVSVTTDRGVRVLSEVTFRVRPGECVAIVGASGSGKSTIALLAARLLDPDAGVIRLDGHDLRAVDLPDLRRHVVLVEQEPTLLHGSLADNVRYARPEASDQDIAAATRAAGLTTFVEALPRGFQTLVGERGLAVSAGERQRIALARAFLADPSVLVLDEPTAALDPVSERAVTEGYESVMRHRTTILISHRRELAMRANRVVVLDGAVVAEIGAPDELLAQDGQFARLFGVPAELDVAR